jgi:hypothetical protein
LLRFGKLGITLLQYIVELGDLLGPVLQIGRDQPFGLLGLSGGNPATLLVELVSYLCVDGIPGRGDLFLLLANRRFPGRDLSWRAS